MGTSRYKDTNLMSKSAKWCSCKGVELSFVIRVIISIVASHDFFLLGGSSELRVQARARTTTTTTTMAIETTSDGQEYEPVVSENGLHYAVCRRAPACTHLISSSRFTSMNLFRASDHQSRDGGLAGVSHGSELVSQLCPGTRPLLIFERGQIR